MKKNLKTIFVFFLSMVLVLTLPPAAGLATGPIFPTQNEDPVQSTLQDVENGPAQSPAPSESAAAQGPAQTPQTSPEPAALPEPAEGDSVQKPDEGSVEVAAERLPAASLNRARAVAGMEGESAQNPVTSETQLAAAINKANEAPDADTIYIGEATIELTAQLPDITEPLDLVGAGQDATVLTMPPQSGYRHFTVAGNINVGMSGMTIKGPGFGNHLDSYASGGIQAPSAALELEGMVFTGNVDYAPLSGGAVNCSSVTATDCTFKSNSTTQSGGGIYIANDGTFENCLFDGNTAADGGGIFAENSVTLTNSTVSRNTVNHNGGGIYSQDCTMKDSTVNNNRGMGGKGGGVNSYGEINFTNCTLANNQNADAGGGVNTFNSTAAGSKIISCTIVNNKTTAPGGYGGGVAAGRSAPSDASISIYGSVIAGNTTNSIVDRDVHLDLGGMWTSSAPSSANNYNAIGLAANGGSLDKLVEANEGEPVLTANGGDTRTVMPASGSVLIDAVPQAAYSSWFTGNAPSTDQRGKPRPDVSGKALADIGAVEVEYAVISVLVSPQAIGVIPGKTQQFTATVTVSNGAPQTVDWSVDGTDSSIDGAGLLRVGENETATALTVTAASAYDDSKKNSATVAVLYPAVQNVSVTPENAAIDRGGTQQFAAHVAVINEAPLTVDWSVDGTDSSIDGNGLLRVGENETATALTVTAASTFDSSKSGAAAVKVNIAAPGTLFREWTDSATGIKLSGTFLENAVPSKLIVNRIPQGHADYASLLLAGKTTISSYDISFDAEYALAKGEKLLVIFPLDAELNGKEILVRHKLENGAIEEFSAVVQNGAVQIRVEGLSPFMLLRESDPTPAGGGVRTGDETDFALWIVLCVIAGISIAGIILYNRWHAKRR